jgi:hypothetical protein
MCRLVLYVMAMDNRSQRDFWEWYCDALQYSVAPQYSKVKWGSRFAFPIVALSLIRGLMSQPRNQKHKWTSNQRDSRIRTRLLPMRSIIPQISQPPLPLLFWIDRMEPRTRMASIRWSLVVQVKEEEDTDAQTGKNSVEIAKVCTRAARNPDRERQLSMNEL